MVDTDTFLIILYVMVDDLCKSQLPPERRPGPKASLTRSEVLTLAIFGQWAHFQSEHGFYRYARCHLHAAFPTLPHRTQFNRLLPRHRDAIVAFSLHLVEVLGARHCPCEALDGSAVPTRDVKGRGAGWRVSRTSAGATDWAGTRASICSPPSIRWG